MKFFYETGTTNDKLVKEVLCQMAKIYIDDNNKVYVFCDDCFKAGRYGVRYVICYNYPEETYLSNEEERNTVCKDCLENLKYTHHILNQKKFDIKIEKLNIYKLKP